MSMVEVVVGKLPEDLEQHVLEELGFDLDSIEDGESTPPEWTRYEGPEVRLSLLNLASLVHFTDHVARLEGFKDSGRALGRMRFKNLPLWETSVWLPTRLNVLPTPRPVSATFIGSAVALLEELGEIQRASDLELGSAPEGNDRMRADSSAFRVTPFRLADDRDIHRWVRRGLWDGAEAAVKLGAPAWLFAS